MKINSIWPVVRALAGLLGAFSFFGYLMFLGSWDGLLEHALVSSTGIALVTGALIGSRFGGLWLVKSAFLVLLTFALVDQYRWVFVYEEPRSGFSFFLTLLNVVILLVLTVRILRLKRNPTQP